MTKRQEPITQPRFILAEGFEDAAFIRALIQARSNIPAFDVSPVNDIGEKQGNSGFEDAIIKLEPFTGFIPYVQHVVVISDNDDDPAGSFKNVCDQIEKARTFGLFLPRPGDAWRSDLTEIVRFLHSLPKAPGFITVAETEPELRIEWRREWTEEVPAIDHPGSPAEPNTNPTGRGTG
jgi:hypothetical protein